jgi:hypothetical protein
MRGGNPCTGQVPARARCCKGPTGRAQFVGRYRPAPCKRFTSPEFDPGAFQRGIGFGNAGVHLAHACSYGVSGLARGYAHPAYAPGVVPHGISVGLPAPAVFRATAAACRKGKSEKGKESIEMSVLRLR